MSITETDYKGSPSAIGCFSLSDYYYMKKALEVAHLASQVGEVPVGAVLVAYEDDYANVKYSVNEDISLDKNIDNIEGQILSEGFNKPISTYDPTAHAEIVALREACRKLNNYRLPPNTTLYVTLEPCTMCVGALIHSRLNRLVFATSEPRAGMVGSQMNLLQADFYNHKILVQSGLMAEESSQLLKSFFRERRKARSKK